MEPRTAVVSASRAAWTSGRWTATGIESTWLRWSPGGSPGSTLVTKLHVATPEASVTSAILPPSVEARRGLAGASSGPQARVVLLGWKTGNGIPLRSAQSARTGGQLGRSPEVTVAV